LDLIRRVAAEFIGTGFLLAAVVGSGIMGERLSAGNSGIALLANTIATGAALIALILTFGPISGAHFNSRGDSGPLRFGHVCGNSPR
jgi:glycerol uptake facilitator-like aquaporin